MGAGFYYRRQLNWEEAGKCVSPNSQDEEPTTHQDQDQTASPFDLLWAAAEWLEQAILGQSNQDEQEEHQQNDCKRSEAKDEKHSRFASNRQSV